MEQPSARDARVIEIARILRKWKWPLALAGFFILAATLAFVLIRSRNNFTLAVLFPKQVSLSFEDKDDFQVSARSLNKYDYERLTLFLLNRELFSRYVRELPGGPKADPDGSYDLRALIIPNYAVDFSNASVRNETLQFLLLKSAPAQHVTVELIGDFVLHVFKNYYLLKIFQDYYNNLQSMDIKYLDSQRMIEDGIAKISLKIAQLRDQEKTFPGDFAGRGDFLLQLNEENERYLGLRQQLSANEILLRDSQSALALNRKKIARTGFLIGWVSTWRQAYQDILYRDPNVAKSKLLEMKQDFADRELGQEFQKLLAFFELVDFNYKLYRGDPLMLKDKYLVFKALAILIFAFGLLLLAVLGWEHWRNARA
jgi:hypothetical protein